MNLLLIADIGGTNARFALWDGHRPTQVAVLAPADFTTPNAAVHHYLRGVGATAQDLQAVCLACAGPVLGDCFDFTNNHWQLGRSQFCQEFGLNGLLLVNDFVAQALAITRLDESQLQPIRPGQAVADAPRLVIGPGTGLGASALVPLANGHWQALAGEGGHVDLPIGNAEEYALWQWLQDNIAHFDAEQVLSGPGLVNLYRAMAQRNGWSASLADAQAITQAALAGDGQARAVVEQFCCFLGRVVGNAVLTLGARGGVYLVGGILPRIAGLFKDSGFVRCLNDKGKMSAYVSRVPVWLVTAESPGLLGAGVALQQHLEAGAL